MTEKTKSALLVGASGLVGGHCLRLLLGAEEYSRVVVLGRRKLDAAHPKLEQYTIDFDNPVKNPSWFSVNDFFCCLGTTIAKAGTQEAFARVDRDYPATFAETANKFGATRCLLVSSVGADKSSRNFYLRTKGEAEELVSAIPFRAVDIFRPSMLLGARAEIRWKEKLFEPLLRASAGMMFGGLRRYRPIEASDVASAMLAAARRDAKGKHIYEGEELFALAAELNSGRSPEF